VLIVTELLARLLSASSASTDAVLLMLVVLAGMS